MYVLFFAKSKLQCVFFKLATARAISPTLAIQSLDRSDGRRTRWRGVGSVLFLSWTHVPDIARAAQLAASTHIRRLMDRGNGEDVCIRGAGLRSVRWLRTLTLPSISRVIILLRDKFANPLRGKNALRLELSQDSIVLDAFFHSSHWLAFIESFNSIPG